MFMSCCRCRSHQFPLKVISHRDAPARRAQCVRTGTEGVQPSRCHEGQISKNMDSGDQQILSVKLILTYQTLCPPRKQNMVSFSSLTQPEPWSQTSLWISNTCCCLPNKERATGRSRLNSLWMRVQADHSPHRIMINEKYHVNNAFYTQ